jgi:hypothetical protein
LLLLSKSIRDMNCLSQARKRWNLELQHSDNRHFEKDFEPRISTLRGIKIDWSDENENAADSSQVNPEPDSNVINESDWQFKNILNQQFQH